MYDIIGERTDKDKGNTARPLCVRCAVGFFVRVHRSDTGGLAPGKENLCTMTENMQADGV